MTHEYRHGDRVIVRLSDGTLIPGRVRTDCEWHSAVAVMVDCDDGWQRYVKPTRLRPELRLAGAR